MNDTLRLILSLSLSGTVLALIIFAVKPLIRHKLPKSIQYYLWLVVLLRLILPFSLEGSIMNNIFYNEQNSTGIAAKGIGLSENYAGSNEGNSSILPYVGERTAKGAYNYDTDHSRYFKDLFSQYALYLWLLGVIIILAANLTGYARFSRQLKKSSSPASDEQNRILAHMLNGRRNVRLARNSFVATPMLKGIIKPCIIIPDSEYEEGQLRNILLHELSHLRRFDIVVKWLTMLAASIHWFNPFIHFIKREIDCACELACDELVIKNLNPAEKQAYGDTLISVAAERKYPVGVLQATMCEEKTNLKERLTAIINYNKGSRLIIAISVMLLAAAVIGAVVLGAGVGKNNTRPPEIYISAEGINTKEAIMGTYSWKYLGGGVESDSDHPVNFRYGAENIVSTTTNQQIIISTQKLKSDKKYNFTIDEISVYTDNQLIYPNSQEPHFVDGKLYLQTPSEAGEYIYCLILNYKDRGTVNYGFVVRVDMMTYDLTEIYKFKTPYVGDHTKVLGIAGSLPAPDMDFRQRFISMITSSKPYKLNIFYEVKQKDTNRREWTIENPDETAGSNLLKNALVVFCMIDNLDEVTFAFRNSQSDGKLDESAYNTSYTFTRTELEEQYGDLSVLGGNPGLLEAALTEE